MSAAGPGSERFINPSMPIETADDMIAPAPEDWQGTLVEQPAPAREPQLPEAASPAPAPTLPPPPFLPPPSLPVPPLPAPQPVQAAPGAPPISPAATASTTIFRLERDRLAALSSLNWGRVQTVLWIIGVSVALGFLLLLPPARSALTPLPKVHIPPGSHLRPPTPHRPLLETALFVIGVGGPLLALATTLIALPILLWREVRLRRQRDLHLAIGRQGLLFFLPSRPGYWFLLPWGHITQLSDATIMPRTGRSARLRTVLWRRLARLRRAFQHGRQLGDAAARPQREVRSPFLLHARNQQPRQMLRLVCYAPLPASGYGWLFRLAPFTRLVGPTSFLLETGWFEPARSEAPATPGTAAAFRRPTTPGILHRLLLNLWAAPLSRAQRPTLPLPRSSGAVILNAPATPGIDVEARLADRAGWTVLPLVPALSVASLIIARVAHQPVERAAVLNAATLVALTLGLGLLLAGVRRAGRGGVFISGAALLALAGLLNMAYGLIAQLADWPWRYHTAPGEPLLFLELLAGLLIALGAGALALEGSGRPGARPPASAGQASVFGVRPHSAELALTLGLFALGLARLLADIDRAVLSSSGKNALLELRYALAEPLLPLAIIGLSYFAPLAGPALQSLFQMLQIIYGVTLALLVPAIFLIAQRATHGKGLLPLFWPPLLAVELLCGLAAVVITLLDSKAASQAAGDQVVTTTP